MDVARGVARLLRDGDGDAHHVRRASRPREGRVRARSARRRRREGVHRRRHPRGPTRDANGIVVVGDGAVVSWTCSDAPTGACSRPRSGAWCDVGARPRRRMGNGNSRARRACRSGGACSRRRITRGRVSPSSAIKTETSPRSRILTETKTETERTRARSWRFSRRLGPRTDNRLCRSWRFEGTRSVVRTIGRVSRLSRAVATVVCVRSRCAARRRRRRRRRSVFARGWRTSASRRRRGSRRGGGGERGRVQSRGGETRGESRRRRRRARRDGQGRDGGGGGASTIRVRAKQQLPSISATEALRWNDARRGAGRRRPPPSPRGSRRRPSSCTTWRISASSSARVRRVAQTATSARPERRGAFAFAFCQGGKITALRRAADARAGARRRAGGANWNMRALNGWSHGYAAHVRAPRFRRFGFVWFRLVFRPARARLRAVPDDETHR